MSFNNQQIVIRDDNGQQDYLGLNNLTATTNPTVTDDIDLGYEVGSTWINTASGAIFKLVDSTDGAAVWQEITSTGVDPAIKLLNTTTGIDCTATGQTTVYTVPAATTTYVTQMLVEITTITGGTGVAQFPKVSTGIGGTFDNIFADTRIKGLDATTEFYHFNTSGVSATGAATNVISFSVNTASNATAYTVSVYLFGYNK